MAKITVKVKVDWSNGKQLKDGTWTGARPIIPSPDETGLAYMDDEVRRGGFDGWVDLPSAEKVKADYAEIYLDVSTDKLVALDLVENKDIEVKALLDDSAIAIEKSLVNFKK